MGPIDHIDGLLFLINPLPPGLEIKKNIWSQFVTSYKNLVATLSREINWGHLINK